MGIGYNYKKYENLMDDDLVKEAAELLKKRRDKMSNWIKENKPLENCPECDSNDIKYTYNSAICKDCGYKEDKFCEYPVKGGVVASRTLESCIKEIFSLRMAEKRKEEKPDEEDLNTLPFEVNQFDTGEFSKSETDFLRKRYNRYLEEASANRGVDEFYIRSLVLQELKIMKMTRKEFNGFDIDSNSKKREYSIYNKLNSKVKTSKDTRDGEDQQDALSELISKNDQLDEEIDVDEEIKEFKEEFKKVEEYKEKAAERRKEVGNPYG